MCAVEEYEGEAESVSAELGVMVWKPTPSFAIRGLAALMIQVCT